MNLRPAHTRVAAIVASLAIGVAAAGCGSSSSSSSSSTPAASTTTATASISKAEFVTKGNALCAHSQAVRKTATAKFGPKGPTQAQLTTYVRKVFIPSVQRNIDQIRALGFPAADAASLTQLFSLAQMDLNRLKANPALLASGPTLFHNFAVPVHRYGLTECAKNA